MNGGLSPKTAAPTEEIGLRALRAALAVRVNYAESGYVGAYADGVRVAIEALTDGDLMEPSVAAIIRAALAVS